MKTIRTILFPTDFTDSSVVAWKHTLMHEEKARGKTDGRPCSRRRASVTVGRTLQTPKMAMSGGRAKIEPLYPILIRTAHLDYCATAVEHVERTKEADVRHLELLEDELDKRGRLNKVHYVVCAQ